MIAIIDSGVANLTSVQAAFDRLGAPAQITDDPARIAAADRVILPGVGAAPAAMKQLAARGLIEVIKALRQPVLGICLGMQLLFEASEEGAENGAVTPCLGLIPGTVRKIKGGPETPVPHMGWNQLTLAAKDHPLLRGIEDGAYLYFVHSFAAPVDTTTLAACTYGASFAALCGHNNFYGAQFHPERSGAAGQMLLKNFWGLKA